MKPRGTRKQRSQQLSEKEKKKIVLWSRKRVSQTEIAIRLRASVDTIRAWQKRLGCAVEYRRPITEEVRSRVLELRKQGLSANPIALRTGIGTRSVLKILHDAKMCIPARRPLSQETRAAIDAEIRGRKDFLCRIAKRHGVSVATVQRRKKQILGPARLLSVWPPLQTKGSQIDAAQYIPTAQEMFMRFVGQCVDETAEKFAREGRYSPEEILAARKYLKRDPTPVLDRFEQEIWECFAALRLTHTAASDVVH